jgi:hypothetical protein
LDQPTRFRLVQQLAEILRYAHNTASSTARYPDAVRVLPTEEGAQLSVRDWQTGAADDAEAGPDPTALGPGH